ncbi:Uncharacterised protein [Klebsiella pneumoniae]|nr:Uncharacterised protein [Klebsiella pneumoniae]
MDFRSRDFRRTETVPFGVRHAPHRHVQTGITCSPVGHQGEDDAFLQGRNDIALRLQHLSGCEMGSVAEQMNAGRPVQLPLVMKAGIKCAGFRFRLRAGVITCVTIRCGVAVMLPGGDRITAHADCGIHRRGGGPVVVIPCGDGAGGNPVPGPHIPDRLCRAVKQTRGFAVGQAYIKLIVQLAVGKNVRIQLTGVIHLRTPVNPHLRQNAPDELKVRFPPLGDNFTRRVGALQPEFKISALQPVLAQHLLHHLRHGLVLKDGALPGVSQQRQARTEREPVVRLVLRGGQPFQAGHHAVDIFAATHPEGGIFHQHLFRWNVRLRGGKLNVPPEGLAQGFAAAKAQNIRLH